MKKFPVFMFLALLAFAIISCDGDDGERGAAGIMGPSGQGFEHVPSGYHSDVKGDGTVVNCKDGYHWQTTEGNTLLHTDYALPVDGACINETGMVFIVGEDDDANFCLAAAEWNDVAKDCEVIVDP